MFNKYRVQELQRTKALLEFLSEPNLKRIAEHFVEGYSPAMEKQEVITKILLSVEVKPSEIGTYIRKERINVYDQSGISIPIEAPAARMSAAEMLRGYLKHDLWAWTKTHRMLRKEEKKKTR
jgi:hypothetical protein